MTDVGEMHVIRGGYVGLADVGGEITNVAAVLDQERLPPGASPADRLGRALERVPAVRARLHQARFEGPTLAVGPFGRYTSRATGTRVALVGDAADFFDPFTGEGIYAALRGAELLVPHVTRFFSGNAREPGKLTGYDDDRRRVFGGKWLLERLIGTVVRHPFLLDHVADRLARDQSTADLLVGATGDFVPARRVLRPSVAWRLVA